MGCDKLYLGVLAVLILAVPSEADPYSYYFTSSSPIEYSRTGDPNPPAYNVSFQFQLEDSRYLVSGGELFYTKTASGDAMLIELFENVLYMRYRRASDDEGVFYSSSGWHLTEFDVKWVTITVNEATRVMELNNATATSYQTEYFPLSEKVYIAGYTNGRVTGGKSEIDFRGCLTDFSVNGVNIFKKAYDGEIPRFFAEKGCPLKTNYMTLSGEDSYLMIRAEDAPENEIKDVEFAFKTHDFNGTLLHIVLTDGSLTINHVGNDTISVEGSNRATLIIPIDKGLGSGLYNDLSLTKDAASLTLSINYPFFRKVLDSITGDIQEVYIGGKPGALGINACLKRMRINNQVFEVRDLPADNLQGVDLGRCILNNDRCEKACSNGGKCVRVGADVTCVCSETMYGGPSCYTPIYPKSCSDVVFPDNVNDVSVMLDVDGTEELAPVIVRCAKEVGGVKTVIERDTDSGAVRIDGFQAPGSYRNRIGYKVGRDAARALVRRAESCSQHVSYTCTNSKLMASPAGSTQSYGWWRGGDNRYHHYWGSAPAESRQCSCSTTEAGCQGGLGCNCDAGLPTEQVDEGLLSNKTHLPVTEVRFGDTGESGDSKFATYEINDVECTGDAGLANIVTLQSLDSSITISRYMRSFYLPMDVGFQFKTTIPTAQLFYKSQGISIMLQASKNIFVKVSLKNMDFQHVQPIPASLDDDAWHSLYFELTTKYAMLKVDGVQYDIWSPTEPILEKIIIGWYSYIGGNEMKSFGFVGCLRDLIYQGRQFDLVDIVTNDDSDSTLPGCMGKCSNNAMCKNGGTCTEYYATYMCDCSTSAFSGCYCGNGIGLTFTAGSWLRFAAPSHPSLGAGHTFSSLELHFTTSSAAGVLAHIVGNSGVLLTIQLNPEGKVVVTYDDGNGQQPTVTSTKVLADNTPHRVTVGMTTANAATTWTVTFDDETQSNNVGTLTNQPVDLFLASTSTAVTTEGYSGCIFGLLYNGVAVLKEAKSTPTPSYITFRDTVDISSNCGSMEAPADAQGEVQATGQPHPLYVQRFGLSAMDGLPTPTSDSVVYQLNSLVCQAPSFGSVSGRPVTGTPSDDAPEPVYMITQNSRPLTCPHLFVRPNRVLLPPDDRVAGEYRCAAKNAWSTSMSDFQTVVLASPPTVPSIVTENVSLNENEHGVLNCDVSSGSEPEAETRWAVVDLNDERFYQSVNGDLHFVSVTQTDASTYKCYQINPRLKMEQLVKTITVTVTPFTGTATAPETEVVFSTPSPVTVDIKSTVTLECLVFGPSPYPEISWGKSENVTSDREISMLKGRRLVMTNITEQDTGDYYCKVGNDTLSTITVALSAKPRWEKGPMPSVVYTGQTAELYCKVPADVSMDGFLREWFIDGEPLQVTERRVLNEAGDVLTVKNASRSNDIFAFECRVSNNLGYVYGNGFLHVAEPLVIVSSPMAKVTVSKAEPNFALKVECASRPLIELAFKWFHNDEYLESTGTNIFGVYSYKSRSTLRLSMNSYTAEAFLHKYNGTYRCEIDDGVEKRSVTTVVEITSSPGDSDSTTINPNAATRGSYVNGLWLSLFVVLSWLTMTLR